MASEPWKRKFAFAAGFAIGRWIIFLSLFTGGLSYGSDTETEPGVGTYTEAAVASDARECSKIGAGIMEKGGSVVDAAIATMVCGGLYNPQSAGLGGGFLMSVYNATSKEFTFINSREVAPLAASHDMYRGKENLSRIGSHAIAVPGEVAGYWEAHRKHGKLPWKDLFSESIVLAEQGIKVSKALEQDMENVTGLDEIFMNTDGTLKKEGDILKRPALAKTLKSIAEKGAYEFYNGTLAKDIIKDINDTGEDSIITLEDLGNYTVEVKRLLNITIGNLTVYTPGPPSSGAVLALILNILKGYNFSSEDMNDAASSALTYHRIVEAFKFAYAHRSELGDEPLKKVEKLVANMISDAYAEGLRLKITDDRTHDSSYYGGDFAQTEGGGTAHHSIIGRDGSAVSVTSTINGRFGSKVRGKRTGIIFNNQMNDFSLPGVTNVYGLPPSEINYIKPRKRPMSSMCPSIVLQKGHKRPLLVTGASGGAKITTATALVIMRSIWFGKSIKSATSAERLHHQLYPEEFQYEEGFDKDILRELRKKNPCPTRYKGRGSVVQSVQSLKDDGFMTAVSDGRKGGCPAGFESKSSECPSAGSSGGTIKKVSSGFCVLWILCCSIAVVVAQYNPFFEP